MQHTALPKLHWLVLAVVMAVGVPAGMAQMQTDVASSSLPDAPSPQSTPTATPPPISTSALPANTQEEQQKKPSSDDVLRQEEKQRAFGVMHMFQTVSLANSKNIPPLRPKQKFQLMLKSTTDPFVFAQDAVLSGIGQGQRLSDGGLPHSAQSLCQLNELIGGSGARATSNGGTLTGQHRSKNWARSAPGAHQVLLRHEGTLKEDLIEVVCT